MWSMGRQDQIVNERIRKLKELRENGINPYAHRFDVTNHAAQIKKENEKFAPVPDRVLIFYSSPEKCLERIESSREGKSAFEKRDYLQNVQNIFKSFTDTNIRFISSDSSLEKVHQQVLSEVQDLFELKL